MNKQQSTLTERREHCTPYHLNGLCIARGQANWHGLIQGLLPITTFQQKKINICSYVKSVILPEVNILYHTERVCLMKLL